MVSMRNKKASVAIIHSTYAITSPRMEENAMFTSAQLTELVEMLKQ